MAALDDLLTELSSLALPNSYTIASATNDVFEAFVLKLVLDGAEAAGGSIGFQAVDGSTPTTLVFRTSPGRIYSTTHAYTHAVIEFDGCPPLEAHIGVQTEGRSHVLHECDVLVLPRTEADVARQREVSPRGGQCVLAIECKFYTSSLQLHLARAFLGLHQDLGTKLSYFVANAPHRRIERLVNHHGRKWETGVLPGSQHASFLVGQFREAFKSYQAARGSIA